MMPNNGLIVFPDWDADLGNVTLSLFVDSLFIRCTDLLITAQYFANLLTLPN
jgi:hypothetical protein